MEKKKLNLQLFADEGQATAAGTETETNAKEEEARESKGTENKPGKSEDEKKYSDADVDRLIDQKFAEWQKRQQKAVDEAKKLAEMNAQEKAEYERDNLQKELDELKKAASLAEMSKTARKMLSDEGINVPDELLSMMVTTDAAETKAAVDGFTKVFKEAVESAVKERLKGEPPKRGTASGAPKMTKEQILAIKDHETRQKMMLANKELFNI